MNLPLEGVKVVELGQNFAGPITSQILGQLGADVVKVERPGNGDDARGWGPPFVGDTGASFHAVNQNKRAITLDLKQPRHLDWLKDYLREADVFVQNLRPGIAAELGLTTEALAETCPRLICCNLWAYGHEGPMRLGPGYEPIVQAFSGLMFQSGEDGGPPIRMGTQVLDQGTAMWSAIGILAALAQRERTGRGCAVDTSLFETALGWLTVAFARYGVTGDLPTRHPTGSDRLIVFQAFETKNGPLVVAAANDRLFAKLAVALGRAEWADDPRFANNAGRFENRDYLLGEIAGIMASRSRGEWLDLLSEAGIPCSPVHNMHEVTAHGQTEAIGMIQQSPGMDLRIMGLPISFDGERPQPRQRAPDLGEHNADIIGDALD
jgi:crotonobetainyl-CoA:carnitine CoA-transferase CaiB-like acyl-CoA transferase